MPMDLLQPLGPPPIKLGGGPGAAPVRIVVCRGQACGSKDGRETVRDLEELTAGVAVCEPGGCMQNCGFGPNAAVHTGNTIQKVSGLRSYEALERVAQSYAGAKLGPLQRKVARLKYAARREDSAEEARALLAEGLGLLGVDAEDTEPKLLAELLMLRSQVRLAAEAPLALEDARRAASLLPDRAQAHLRLAAALEACGRGPEAAEPLRAALSNRQGLGIDRDVVTRRLGTLSGGDAEEAEGYARWQVKRREALNHNCIMLTLASAEPSVTAAHLGAGDVWHVDVNADLGPGIPEAVVRAYTPASSAKEYLQGHLQLAVKVYPDGRMTQHLAKLEPGSILRVSAPHKTLESTAYSSGVVVIAGGSAATVALQICEAVLSRHPQKGLVRLVLCNHTTQDAILAERFAELQQVHAGFRLVHCLSDSPLPKGHLGRFTTQVLAEIEQHLPIVVSGPPGLCRAAHIAATALGRDIVVLDGAEEDQRTRGALQDKAIEGQGARASPQGEVAPESGATLGGSVLDPERGAILAGTLQVPGGSAHQAGAMPAKGSQPRRCCAVM